MDTFIVCLSIKMTEGITLVLDTDAGFTFWMQKIASVIASVIARDSIDILHVIDSIHLTNLTNLAVLAGQLFSRYAAGKLSLKT
jgi:hypothetical protein